MNCSDAQSQIVRTSGALDETTREHLASCEDCRAFRLDCERLVATTLLDEPSPELDAAILRQARERSAAGRGAPPLLLTTGRAWWFAAAAGLVLACVLWLPPAREPSQGTAGARQVAQHAAPGLPWQDSDIDSDLMALEAELLLLDPAQSVTALKSELGVPSARETPATGGDRSIDEAIQKLDTDLLLEWEDLRVEPPLSVAPSPLAPRLS